MSALLIGASDTEVPDYVAITHDLVHRPAPTAGEQAWTIPFNIYTSTEAIDMLRQMKLMVAAS